MPHPMPSAALRATVADPGPESMGTSSPLRLEALGATPRRDDPYPHLFVPGFVHPAALIAIERDFPVIRKGGSYPLPALRYGPAFAALVAAVESDQMRQQIEQKFGLVLTGRPTLVTVRGMIRPGDGTIHTDSTTKLITMLIYLGSRWDGTGGCLRVLRGSSDLTDYVLEIPPVGGNMLVFQRSDISYHGHLPAQGDRHVLQVNWITDVATRDYELARHRRSAWLKRLNPFG